MPEVRDFIETFEDSLDLIESEWGEAWDVFDRDMETIQAGFWDLFSGMRAVWIPIFFSRFQIDAYILARDFFDALATLLVTIQSIPAKVGIQAVLALFPLPEVFKTRAVSLDMGIRIGLQLFADACIAFLRDPNLVMEKFLARIYGRAKLARFLKTIPDFDPVEAADLFRKSVGKFAFVIAGAVVSAGFLLGLLFVFAGLYATLNDPINQKGILDRAWSQDSARVSGVRYDRWRINNRRGKDQ